MSAIVMIVAALALTQAAGPPSGVPAIGEYRLGMTREQVRAIKSCAPYKTVPGTKGLECENFVLGSRKMNISFVFTGDALSRIQLWFHEGPSEADARKATEAMLAYLSARGPIHSDEVKGATPLTADAVFSVLKARDSSGKGARVQVLTTATRTPPFVHGSITKVAAGYYVFVYFSATSR
jgi:hypothetical protein